MLSKRQKKDEKFKFTDENCKRIKQLIEKLTHSGKQTLDDDKFQELKSICMISDNYVTVSYELIIHQLQKKHSEIRFSSFQLIDKFCRKSYLFRDLVMTNLKDILALTTEIESTERLPPPYTVARTLEKLALETLYKWYKRFGSNCKTLDNAVNYLMKCKQIDFKLLKVEYPEERQKRNENESRVKAVKKQHMERVKAEIKDLSADIRGTLKSFENGLALLLPTPDDFFITSVNEDVEEDCKNTDSNYNNHVKNETQTSSIGESDDSDVEDNEYEPVNLREIGALNSKHCIQLDLAPTRVIETQENTAIIENIRDLMKLIMNKYLPKTKVWLQIIKEAEGSKDKKCKNLIKKVNRYKSDLEKSIERYRRLNIKMLDSNDDCVSTDSEMEEVEYDTLDKQREPQSENKLLRNNREVDEGWSIISKEEKPEDPTTLQSVVALQQKRKEMNMLKIKHDSEIKTSKEVEKLKENNCETFEETQPTTSKESVKEIDNRKRKLLEKAPKLPYDVDLYHWEEEHVKAPTLLPVALDGHRFWSSVSADDGMEIEVPEGSASLRTRVIEFVGDFEPVKRSCRYPLPNGKLCPRLDRYKCPFHGVIVPRDESGKCVDPEDERRQKIKEEKEQAQKPPDWQDPALLKAIELETGINLKMPEKRGKGVKKKKYPGLTDIKKLQDTPMNRLRQKVFKPTTMKKVARTLDSIDRRRYRDKYGDQFHYMYDTS